MGIRTEHVKSCTYASRLFAAPQSVSMVSQSSPSSSTPFAFDGFAITSVAQLRAVFVGKQGEEDQLRQRRVAMLRRSLGVGRAEVFLAALRDTAVESELSALARLVASRRTAASRGHSRDNHEDDDNDVYAYGDDDDLLKCLEVADREDAMLVGLDYYRRHEDSDGDGDDCAKEEAVAKIVDFLIRLAAFDDSSRAVYANSLLARHCECEGGVGGGGGGKVKEEEASEAVFTISGTMRAFFFSGGSECPFSASGEEGEEGAPTTAAAAAVSSIEGLVALLVSCGLAAFEQMIRPWAVRRNLFPALFSSSLSTSAAVTTTDSSNYSSAYSKTDSAARRAVVSAAEAGCSRQSSSGFESCNDGEGNDSSAPLNRSTCNEAAPLLSMGHVVAGGWGGGGIMAGGGTRGVGYLVPRGRPDPPVADALKPYPHYSTGGGEGGLCRADAAAEAMETANAIAAVEAAKAAENAENERRHVVAVAEARARAAADKAAEEARIAAAVAKAAAEAKAAAAEAKAAAEAAERDRAFNMALYGTEEAPGSKVGAAAAATAAVQAATPAVAARCKCPKAAVGIHRESCALKGSQ